MALNDVRVISGGGAVNTFRVADRTTSSDTVIYAGDPVSKYAENYVGHTATGAPTNAAPMMGIAVNTSTETATADGTVDVMEIIPGKTILECKATTPANIDTDAELLAILNDAVTFDLTSTTYTIDENEGDDPDVHGLIILSGDIDKGTLRFKVKEFATEQGGTV